MARKGKAHAHENHERWLVSYADFITLLFAFFVVMFASSQTDKAKAEQVSDSVKKALSDGKMTAAIAAVLGGTAGETGQGNALRNGPGGVNRRGDKPPEPVVELSPSFQDLSQILKQEIEAGKLSLKLTPRGLVISLREAAFFPSGEDVIDPRTLPSIEKIATAILKIGNPVRLEGHTDSLPIHNARFRNNWVLSAARSVTVLELLTKTYGIPEDRLAVAGYAATAPADTNETTEGRARNRRVDIVILTRFGAQAEPAAPTAGNKSPSP